MSMRKKLHTYSFLLLVLLLSINCAKRQTQPAPTLDKEEVDKKEFLQYLDEDLKQEGEEAGEALFQTEIIGRGDRLSLKIYEKLPVSQDAREEIKRVDEAGNIFILPIGEMKLAGLRIAEAEQKIEDAFSDFVVSPHCEINIEEKLYEPRVYIFGEVSNSGSVPYKRGDRLLDAISYAKGCKDDAYKRSIKVVRFENEKINIYTINLKEILEGGNLYKNIPLRDRDVVFVPRRFLTGFKEVMGALALVMPWYLFARTVVPQ